MSKSEKELDEDGLDKSEIALGKTPGPLPWRDQYDIPGLYSEDYLFKKQAK